MQDLRGAILESLTGCPICSLKLVIQLKSPRIIQGPEHWVAKFSSCWNFEVLSYLKDEPYIKMHEKLGPLTGWTSKCIIWLLHQPMENVIWACYQQIIIYPSYYRPNYARSTIHCPRFWCLTLVSKRPNRVILWHRESELPHVVLYPCLSSL